MRKIVIIDGKSVFYRGYYAMGNLSLPDGTPTGAVYGFASILLTVLEKLKPDNVYVAWDIKGTSTSKRSKIFPEYKAGRKLPPADFYTQIPILKELLDNFNIPFYELDHYEADDIIGSLAHQAVDNDINACIISSDLDMLQLLDKNVKMYALKTGFSKIEEYTPEYFYTKHGIKVSQYLDYKSLRGDPSDNIPGVSGIGEKTAIDLLKKYKTMDKLYTSLDCIMMEKPAVAKKLIAGKSSALMSRELARIYIDAPIILDLNRGRSDEVDADKAIKALERLSFKSLVTRFDKIFKIETAKDENQLGLFSSEVASLNSHSVHKVTSLSQLKQLEADLTSKDCLLEIISGMAYLSDIKQSQIYELSLKLLANLGFVKFGRIVSYDFKQTLRLLNKKYCLDTLNDLLFKVDQIYDLNQAEFLIDPLSLRSEPPELFVSDMNRLKQMYTHQEIIFGEVPSLRKVAEDIDFPLIPVLFLMEKRGVKIDKAEFERLSKRLSQQIADLGQQIYSLSGTQFNLNSPMQLSHVLFDSLGLPTNGIKKTQKGYSTGKRELDKLVDSHQIIRMVMDYREISKIKNTYVDALPNQTDSEGYLHTTFRQDITATGRLSSTNPNLQNIPVKTELGQEVRKGFIARTGKLLVSADYAQFELRLVAALSEDQEMMDIFNSNRDFHAEMAAQIYQIPVDKVSREQRRIAKTVNFSVLYGAGPRNLQQTTGLTYQESKALIDRYFKLRYKVRDYMNDVLKKADENGYVETYFGRRRPTPDLKSSNFQVREAAKRASANMPLQGTGADLMKMAMFQIEKKLSAIEGAEQILQIHDSILVEIFPKDELKVKQLLIDTMVNICPAIPIRFSVDIQTGLTWQGL